MRIVVQPEALSLLSRINKYLNSNNIESYLVGGFVRDALLKRRTADIDIAIACDPIETGALMASELGGTCVPLDFTNRIARVVLISEDNGISSRWDIDLSLIIEDIENDLARRDFTINAIAVPLGQAVTQSGVKVIDPHQGLADIKRGIIRAVSPNVFKQDPVRLLRAFRLAAQLGFQIDATTEALLKESAALIKDVAGERVREELLRLLRVPGAGHFISAMENSGLVTAVFPELLPAKGVEQPVEHHWDVFEHSLETVKAAEFILGEGDWNHVKLPVNDSLSWSAAYKPYFAEEVSYGSSRGSLLKLAALLHDVAKPQNKTVEENGKVRFLGHPEQGAETASTILGRLRFSNKEIKLIEELVRYHMRPRQMSSGGLPTRRAIYRFFRDTESAGIDILFLSLADHLASRGPELDYEDWLAHVREVEYIINAHNRVEQQAEPSALINGNDLINIYGMSPGPEIGRILEEVREAQAAGEISTREEALSCIRECLLAKGCSQV